MNEEDLELKVQLSKSAPPADLSKAPPMAAPALFPPAVAEAAVDPASARSVASTTAASYRVRVGPPEAWVAVREIDPAAPSAADVRLIDDQYLAADNARYHRMVRRFGTLQNVHEGSNWSLAFDPATDEVVIHWLRVSRAGRETRDYAAFDRVRYFQREQGLEAFVLDGTVTLMVLLEDIRVGDVVDCAFTIRHQPRLFPRNFSVFTNVSFREEVAHFVLSVRFPAARPMRWKMNRKGIEPQVIERDGETEWRFERTNVKALPVEEATPADYLAGGWLQISDHVSWQQVAARLDEAWQAEADDPVFVREAEEIATALSGEKERLERALRRVQDDIRYLSINTEFGGQVPSGPGLVLERGYGDCKDKSFLLVCLLRRLGFAARAVLVHSRLRGGIGDWLPSDMFNHVLIEYEFEGAVRWVDATLSLQGGGPIGRPLPEFGLGLPIDAKADALIPLSGPEESSGTFELREVFQLATREPSLLEVEATLTGAEAEALRRALAFEGPASVEAGRLNFYQRLHPGVRRTSALECEEDREANRLVLRESFEIEAFGRRDQEWIIFDLSAHLVLARLARTAEKQRRTPLALYWPCSLTHEIEVHAAALPGLVEETIGGSHRTCDAEYRSRSAPGVWILRYRYQTNDDAVAPGELSDYYAQLEKFFCCTGISPAFPVNSGSLRPARSRIPARLRNREREKGFGKPSPQLFRTKPTAGLSAGTSRSDHAEVPGGLRKPWQPAAKGRRALADSASTPVVAERSPAPIVVERDAARSFSSAAPSFRNEVVAASVPPRRSRRLLWILVSIVLLVAGIGGIGFWLARDYLAEQGSRQEDAKIETDPRFPSIEPLVTQGRLAEASGRARELVAAYPLSPRAHLIAGEVALRINDPATALREADAATKLSPGAPAAAELKIQALAMLGRWAEIDQVASEPLRQQARKEVLVLVAQAEEHLQRPAGAEKTLRGILAGGHSPLSAFDYLTHLLVRNGRLAEARKLWDEALLTGGPAELMWLSAVRFSMIHESAEQAADRFKQALAEIPNCAPLHFEHGLWLVRQNKLSEGLESLRQAAQFEPRAPDIWLAIGCIYEQNGQSIVAADAYRKALAFCPNDPSALLNRARAGSGCPGATRLLLDKAEGLGPAEPAIWRGLAECWEKIGEPDRATAARLRASHL